MRTIIAIIAIILVQLSSSNIAHADDFSRMALLKCDEDKNEFIIRFGTIYPRYEDAAPVTPEEELTPVSRDIQKKWDSRPSAKNNTCTLSDGKKIEVSVHSGIAFAYGVGGADPNVFFTLKVDNRPIFYKSLFYAGYSSLGVFVLESLYYDGKDLSQGISARLTAKSLPHEEAEALRRDKRKEELGKNVSQSCRDMRNLLSQEYSYSDIKRINSNGFASRATIDINNDGNDEYIIRIGGGPGDCGAGCGNHYFDGSLILSFETKEKADEFYTQIGELDIINALFDARDERSYFYKSVIADPKWNAHIISINRNGNSPHYIYNTPVKHEGKTYISTFEVRETAIIRRSLSLITPEYKATKICEYPD